jgi:predicted metal-dependent hydrolase
VTLDFGFPVEVIRTGRTKSASIELDGEKVKVTVPSNLSDQRIKTLIQQKTVWIKQKLQLQRESSPVKPKEYVSGETFQYLGKNYRLKRLSGPSEGVKMKSGYLVITASEGASNDSVRASLEGWYKRLALSKLTEKTHRYAAFIGLEVGQVTVRDFKARWGSCYLSGDIAYNWRIIMAPQKVIDYVVVHELCHLLEHNHSSKYWKHVEAVARDYKECREWLKLYGSSLVV